MPPHAAATFKVQDAPGTSASTTYSFWSPGFSYYSVAAPGGPLPHGYPPGPSLVPGPQPAPQTAAASMSKFHASPDVKPTYAATPCPDCGQLVKVSPTTTYHMDTHRESQRCKRASARRAMKTEEAKASATRIELFSTSPGQGTTRGGDQGAGGFVAGGSAGAVRTYNPWNMSDTKGKGREIAHSMEAASEKRYRDAGVQADVVLPREPAFERRAGRQARRRCQSEPPLFHTELQGVQGRAHPSGAKHAEEKSEKETVVCFQCEEILLRRNVRSHVGGHALRQLVGAPEGPSMKYAIHPGNPCGFCGRSGCDIRLVKATSPASKYTAAASNCPHAHTFSLNKARRFSTVMPCTNVPIQCALCPKDPVTKLRPVYWKYSMFYHIQTAHPEHWDCETGRVKNLGVNFRRLLSISQKELDTVAPGRTRPYPGPIGEAEEGEEELVISNKRAAVEALIRSTSRDSPQMRPKGS